MSVAMFTLIIQQTFKNLAQTAQFASASIENTVRWENGGSKKPPK
jgi:hypothetical protein